MRRRRTPNALQCIVKAAAQGEAAATVSALSQQGTRDTRSLSSRKMMTKSMRARMRGRLASPPQSRERQGEMGAARYSSNSSVFEDVTCKDALMECQDKGVQAGSSYVASAVALVAG